MICSGCAFFHQGEIHLVVLFTNTGKIATLVDDVVKISARKYTVMVHLIIFLYVEINAAVALVSKTVVENLFHQLHLLNYVASGMRFDAGRQHIEIVHRIVEAVCKILRHFHRFKLLKPRFLGYFILTFVGVVLKMAHVGNIPHIAHLISYMLQITEHHVESDCGTRVSEMRIAINCRAANIHSYPSRSERLELLLHSGACVVDQKLLNHDSA